MRIESFFASCFFISALFSQNTTYHDPQGRFQIDRPPEWRQVSLGGDGVEFVNGSAFAVLMAFPACNWNAALVLRTHDSGPLADARGSEDTLQSRDRKGANLAVAVLDRVSGEIRSQYRNFAVVKRGAITVDGRPGAFVSSTGVNPQGLDSFVTLIATGDGQYAYVLMAAGPRAQYQRLQPVLSGIADSFRFGSK